MAKEKTPAKLAVPNAIPDHDRQRIAAVLNPLVADAFALYVKTKNFHWHASGSHFRDYHLLFDEQAAHEICEQGNDVATTSILEIFIDETERRAWFLFETTQR